MWSLWMFFAVAIIVFFAADQVFKPVGSFFGSLALLTAVVGLGVFFVNVLMIVFG